LYQRTKYRKDQSDRCGEITIFVIFQDGSRCHLGFQKFKILMADALPGASMHNRAKFHQNRSNSRRYMAI